MAVQIDAYGRCISPGPDGLCGSRIKIVQSEAGVTAILTDGFGGDAKAAILSSLAVKMMLAMLARGEPIDEIADMIVDSQPIGKNKREDYSTFTILQISNSGMIFVSQMETPDAILLRHGKPVDLKPSRKIRQGRVIRNALLRTRDVDTVIAVGNGLLQAGAKRNLQGGWKLKQISAYMANASTRRVTAEKLVRLLLSAGSSLSRGESKDNLSALVFRVSR